MAALLMNYEWKELKPILDRFQIPYRIVTQKRYGDIKPHKYITIEEMVVYPGIGEANTNGS